MLVFGLVLASAASAQIYRWTDAEGRLHFTQRLEQVPAQHRAAAKEGQRRESAPSAAPAPSAAQPTHMRRSRGARVLEIPFERLGHVMKVSVRLNDTLDAPFLIDTGASGVSLPASVAERLGLVVGPGGPTLTMHTANGMVTRSVVQLDAVQLGGARVEGLTATVNPTMEIGLLGGTFFNNFVYQVDAARSVIRLEPNENVRGGLSAEEWAERFQELRAPLARLDDYLATEQALRQRDRERLERHREELQRALGALDQEANRFSVPHRWRAP